MKKNLKKRLLSGFISASLLMSCLSIVPAFGEEAGSGEIPVFKMEDQFLMMEVEDMLLNEAGWKVREHADASGGKYISPQAFPTLIEDVEAKFGTTPAAQLYYDVEEAGYYTIWMRNYYMWGTDGNYWVNLDSEPTYMIHFSNSEHFYWNSLKTTYLTKGRHYIGFTPRRQNMAIDKILITSSEYYAPVGMGEKPAPFKLGKEGESMKNLYFPLPSYTPPAEHPRLYIREKDIPTIKANLTHPQNNLAWEKVKKIADSNTNCKLDSTGAYSFSTDVHKYIEACAFMYVLDRKANLEYGKKAVNGLVDYLSTLTYSGDGLQMARSGIVQYIAKVYDWCHDLISEENKAFIIKKSLAIATKLECGWPPVKLSAFNSDHGSEGAVQVDMLSLAIAMYEDYPDIWNVSAGRFFAEYVAINNFYYDQSWWQAEGDSYGHSRYTYEAKSHAILDKLGISSLISPNDQYLSYNLIYRRRPDGNFLQDGDIWDITFQNSSPSQYKGSAGSLLSGSFRYKDPYLKYELYKMCEYGYQDLANDAGFSLVDFLVLNDVNVGLKSNYDLPLTGYTGEGHNMMTARTGWDDGVNSNTMVVSLKGGGRTRGGHMHADAGNFVIYYKGPLAMDTGVYNGKPFIDENGKLVTNVAAGSYHFANYQQRTIAHNCILVYDPDENMKYHNLGELNDGGQLKHTERVPNTGQTTYKDATDDTKILATRLGVDYGPDMNKPAYSYLKTDITNAYSFKMKEYHRAFMFHNFFDEDYPGALIVMDKVTSSNPEFKKTWLLHSQEEPEVDGQTTTIRRTEWGYNGKLVNQALLPKAEDSVTEKIGGEGKEYWVDGRNVKAIGIVKGDESGKWRIEISPKTPKETDYFLNVLQVSANDKNLEPLKSDLYEIGDYLGVKIKDRATFLTKASKRTSKEVYVHVDGNEEKLLWTVDGLNMGRWSVADENDNVVATVDVTEEGGVAYFEAKAGSYKLTKLRGFNKIPSKNFDIFAGVTEETTPLEPKFAINTLYEYIDDSNPVIDENGIAYIPMDPYFKSVDRLSTYTDEGDTVKLRFEDQDYVVDLNTNKVTKIWQYVEMNGEINVTNNIKRINGKLYIPHTFFTEVFDKVCSYDTFAKIVRLENGFTRPSDYIIASEDPTRINVKATSDEHSALSTKAYMALDGDIAESRWGSDIIGGNATYEFTEEAVLNKVRIYWYQPTQRSYNYEFQVSEDGVNFKTVLEGNTGYTGEYAEYEFEPVKAKYFKVIAKGNILNNWFNMYEIQFFKSN